MITKPKLTVELDEYELAVRLFVAATGELRPIGVPPRALLMRMTPEQRGEATRSAKAAIQYFQERIIRGSGRLSLTS